MKILDKNILRQTLSGYIEVNRITEGERLAWLKKVTEEEALNLFDRICQNLPDLDDLGGSDLSEYRIAHHLKVREAMQRLAKSGGYESAF